LIKKKLGTNKIICKIAYTNFSISEKLNSDRWNTFNKVNLMKDIAINCRANIVNENLPIYSKNLKTGNVLKKKAEINFRKWPFICSV